MRQPPVNAVSMPKFTDPRDYVQLEPGMGIQINNRMERLYDTVGAEAVA